MLATVLSAVATLLSGAAVVLVFVRLPDRGASEPPAEPEQWLERVLKQKILVHTLDDKSIEGVLMEQTDDGVILRAAKLLGEKQSSDVEMAGEVFVPRANVAFAQLGS